MRNQPKYIEDLKTKDYIINRLKDEYKGRVFVISTPDILADNKEWKKWADRVVKEIYNCDRREMKTYAYYFSYIKFAKNKKNDVYGIVNGKGQFHWNNESDVDFFDIGKYDNDKSKFMQKNDLQWYSEEIVILKNINDLDEKEAYSNETDLHQKFHLFD
ncbi:MAG: hypothetical protein HDT16_04010 [Oscillibacter sp.]|nr:hypothetical protein [Oscillibacter sp.]